MAKGRNKETKGSPFLSWMDNQLGQSNLSHAGMSNLLPLCTTLSSTKPSSKKHESEFQKIIVKKENSHNILSKLIIVCRAILITVFGLMHLNSAHRL